MKPHSFIHLLTLIIATFILTCCSSQDNANLGSVTISASAQADKIINEIFTKENFPGMAIEIMKNGKIVYSKGFGYADIENAIPVNPQTSQFRIGSISKPFTAAGLALLYEEGKVDLDLPIQTYVASFPEKKHEVTLRQLAGHLGGIRHYKGMEFMSNIHYPTVSDGLSIFINDKLIHKPGTKYSYSSYGWNLISAAMESASRQEFLGYLTNEVFKPIGMSYTVADDNTKSIADKVTFYIHENKKNQVAPSVDNSYKWAGGGFLSTAHDMVLFGQAHLEASLLQKETIDLWTTSQITTKGKKINYGIGWRSGEDKKGRPWYGHGGGSVGGSSMLLVFPEEQLVLAMSINLSNAKYGNLPFRVAEQFLNETVD